MVPPFQYTREQMKWLGILELPNAPRPLRNVITFVVVALCFNSNLSSFLYFLLEDKPFFEKTESILNGIGCLHVFSKAFVLPFKRKILLSVMSDLDDMSVDSNRFEEFRRQCDRNIMLSRKIPQTVQMSMCALLFCGTIVSIVQYTTQGTVSAPLQLYVPFKDYNILLTVIYNYFLVLPSTFIFSVMVSTLIALSLNISCQISYLIMKLENLGTDPSSNEIDSCIVLHQKIMRVVTNVNSLISGLLFFEYLLTSMQCCLSGFQLLANKKNDGIAEFLYHCTFFAISVTFSSVNCYCGNIIKLKSENIFEAAYCNNWYSLTLLDRKKLLALLLVSSKPLTLSYRHLITFDLALYGIILKGAYSLVTVLQTMENV
ncbi:unnamed protein product [Nezara viridula]|uniref:Odorant receptor n=1 Tax=Nezara viridula TaxID=85310 RepID=A0A9P0EAG2_NEZVI|nr:unnamed protein product [Nezara viridula]